MLDVSELHGFNVGGVSGPVSIVDDGEATGAQAGFDWNFGIESSTGPYSVVLLTWGKATTVAALSGITWGGNAMSILVQSNYDPGADTIGAAICIIAGAQSGELLATFDAQPLAGAIATKVSLDNLESMLAIDTDAESASAGAADLDSLNSPGANGIRLAVWANLTEATATTWSNATELSDLDSGGGYRHSAAYDLGDDATAIASNGASADELIVGVSLR